MARVGPPNYYGRRLALRLKQLRLTADLLQQDVADKAHFTLQKVSRIESGQVPGYHELRALLEIYGLPVSEWPPYMDLRAAATKRRWWLKYGLQDDEYVPLEEVAAAKYEFQLGQLPTLLQTEDYARAAVAREANVVSSVDGAVAVLMRQQDRLFSDQPIRLHALIHLPTLRRGVDRAQLLHLLRCAQLPNVMLQVLPQRDDLYEGLHSSLIVLSFDDSEEPDIAFSDTLVGRSQTQDARRVSGVRQALNRLAAFAMSTDASLELLKSMIGHSAAMDDLHD